MAKRLMVLLGVLAVMLATAVPALAQEEQYAEPPQYAEETSVTGEVGVEECDPDCDAYKLIGDAGDGYLLSGDVDFGVYEGERITAYGTVFVGDGARVLHVTRVEPADEPVLPPDEVSYTGVIYEFGPEISDRCVSTHSIIDEATGTEQFLKSETVDLGTYVVERVTVYGEALVYPAFLGYELCPSVDVTRVESAGPGTEEEVEVTFELSVEGEPPADATFFGTGVYDPRIMDGQDVPQLMDPDGDGLYVVTLTTVAGDYEAGIVQGAGTETCDPEFGGTCPGEPTRAIKDFGMVALEEDTTLSASVSFDGKPTEPVDPAPGVDVDGDGEVGIDDGEEAARVSDSSKTIGDARVLPDTGGAALTALLSAGALLLVAAGLLVRQVNR